MKKITIGLFITLLIAASCSNKKTLGENEFRLSGTIEGLDTVFYRMIVDTTAEYGYSYDTIRVNKGSFEYVGTATEHQWVLMSPNVKSVMKNTGGGGYIPAKSSLIFFIAYPGADIKFTGSIKDFVDAYPSGDPANDDLAKLHREIFPLLNESANKTIVAYADSTLKDSLLREADKLDEKALELKKKFVVENMSSIAALAYFDDMLLRSQISDDEAIEWSTKIDTGLYSISFCKGIMGRIDAIKKTKIGSVVPDVISSNTLNDSTVNLADYRGKYVVIDFWGTWCGPCVKELPRMKEFYDKNKERVEFVSIADESSDQRWFDFLRKNNYNWPQILNDKKKENFVLKFNIQGFPTKFVIDPNGVIVNKFVGDGDDFFNYMDTVLK